MNSINQNQPEKNREDLRGQDAVKQIKAIIKQTETCFFCTAVGSAPSGNARPMSVRRADDDGTLWFLSASDSHTNAEVSRDPQVTLYFQGSPHSDFLALSGRASITTDHSVIKELWSPLLKTWFSGGLDDPRITAIRFTPETGYYWDNKHGNLVAGAKIMIGAMVGKTLDDSIEGKLKM
jgi:general stress protein 26